MGKKKKKTCLVPACDGAVYARAVCRACHAWTAYHLRCRHDTKYFVEYAQRVERLASRAQLRLQNVRPISRKRRAAS